MQIRLFSDLLRSIRSPDYFPQIQDKLWTKARAAELGMDVPTTYAVFRAPKDLDVSGLPMEFVLKKHVDDAAALCLRQMVDQNGCRWSIGGLRRWFVRLRRRGTYSGVPIKVFAEELIHDGQRRCPRDFKFFVIWNRVHFIQVDLDRCGDHKQVIYTRTWRRTPYYNRIRLWGRDLPDEPRPACLDAMIDFCETFSRTWPVPTIRIDLYLSERGPQFGEAGIYHRGGHPIHPKWDRIMGRLWTNGP